MKIFSITLIFLFISKVIAEDKYNRNSFHFHSYPTKIDIGFYTKKNCKTNIDHVVSLKDAFDSGAFKWTLEKKKEFANDKENHVAACHRINSSKGSATPKVFLRRSRDKKGLEYEIINFCNYVNIYFKIKKKYNLSFKNNNPDLFNKCYIKFKN